MQTGERIPTTIRTLLVLEVLAEAGAPLTATEIGRRLGLPKPTIHRLCATLLDEGLLARDPAAGGFRPGRRARSMANGLLHASADAAVRRQILIRVANAVSETVNFAAPTDEGMTYVDRVETGWAFRIQMPIGVKVPFHATASGKTYLASMPPARRRRMVGALTLTAETAQSHLEADTLLAELAETARRGYAVDREELLDGMVALAVPVTDGDGRYMAALAFHGPTPRLTIDKALDHLDLLRGAASDLTRLIFS